MKQWLRASIFWRLYGVELAAVTLAWLAFGAVTFLDSRSALQEELDRGPQMLAQSLAIGTSLASSPGVAQALGESLRALQIRNSRFPMEPSDLTYRIWKADGTLIAGSRESPSPVDLHADTIPPGQRALRSGWILSAAASPGGQVIAVVGESRTYIERIRRSATRKLLYPYIVLAVALAGVAWVALRVGLRPLRHLAAAVAARPENDLSPLSPRREYVELAPLVSALNGTVARIRRMIEAEREFFADAAHELRTPLAAVGAQAHVVVHETEESNRLTAAKALNEGIERASNVLRRLLVLARLGCSTGRA